MAKAKQVKLSDIASKQTYTVRKQFGNIVVYEMDAYREKKLMETLHQVEALKLTDEQREILYIHSVIIIFTNIRVDVEDDKFAEIITNMPEPLRQAIIEIQGLITESISSLINQIETERKLAQFNEMLKPMKSDVDE